MSQTIYTWYYKNNQLNNDRIGISPDGKFMMHDGMIHQLTKFKTLEKKESKDKIALYLIYKIDNQANLILQEYENVLYFKYFGLDMNNMKFAFVGFNGVEYYLMN
jgi:hypothetical protein